MIKLSELPTEVINDLSQEDKWTESRDAPLILGHMNLFTEFDACFMVLI